MAGHINPAMLNQATAMAQQQLAAANLIAHGLDPRLARLPHPHPALAPLSPSRSQPQGFVPPMPQQQQQPGNVNLARFFSPEVLAQAQSGSAPAMPPLPTQKVIIHNFYAGRIFISLVIQNQQTHFGHCSFFLTISWMTQVLTLEELERQAAAVRI